MYLRQNIFKDKTAVIIGASSGIGAQIAKDILSHGGSTILVSRNLDKLKKTFIETNRKICIQGDISTVKGCKKIYNSIKSVMQAIDYLVITAGQFYSRPLEKTTQSIWDKTINCNLKGPFFIIKHLIPLLEGGNGKSIVVISSILGSYGASNVSAYSASKGGLTLLVKSLAVELASKGFRINSISPGHIETNMITDLLSDITIRNDIIQGYPIKRIGKPSDVSYLALYLLSEMSSWMTGSNIILDGGRSSYT
jgi:NAD(P)-dependent dehydrogenase (short-subunit alcohol dehydrogenase family)